MAKPENRSQLMESLGAEQRNTVWSWCGVNHAERKVYLSVWVDTREKRDGRRISYIIQEPHWGSDPLTGTMSPARKDHDEKLSLISDQGYEVFGYFIEAKDPKATPREIAHTKTSFVFMLDLERRANGTIIGYPTKRIAIA